MGRIAVYRKKPTATERGVTNIAHLKDKKGVYKIFENASLVYIGSSTKDLYTTILRHFQEWNDKDQRERISYKNDLQKNSYTVQVELMDRKTAEQIKDREYKLTAAKNPRDNKNVLVCETTGKKKSCLIITKTERAKEEVKRAKKKAAHKKKVASKTPLKKVLKKKSTIKKRTIKKKEIDDVPF